jgi:hypothetical protein
MVVYFFSQIAYALYDQQTKNMGNLNLENNKTGICTEEVIIPF